MALVKNCIHQFKYDPYIKELATPLAELIIQHIAYSTNAASFADAVLVPVPVRQHSFRRRGFNPAAEIAHVLTQHLQLPVFSDALAKVRRTPPQMKLKREERLKNLTGAFACLEPHRIAQKHCILVDDVFTTGTTLDECARTLKKAGAGTVRGMVVARG